MATPIETTQAMIDARPDAYPQAWADYLDCLANPEHVRSIYVSSRPGFGKTYAALHYCAPVAVYSVTLTPGMPGAELRGHYIPKGGDFIWNDGPALKAFRQTEGVRLVLNELPNAGDDALAQLYPILEDPSTAVLTLPSGETVRPAGRVQIVATGNAPLNKLPADMRDALSDRCIALPPLDVPSPEAIAVLPHELRDIARDALLAGGERQTSLRAWFAFADMLECFDRERAARLAFGAELGRGVVEAIETAEVI